METLSRPPQPSAQPLQPRQETQWQPTTPPEIVIKKPNEVMQSTGLSEQDLNAIRGLDSLFKSRLTPLSTIDWRSRFDKNDPLYEQYAAKDKRQSDHLRAIREGTAGFEVVEDWYRSLGAEFDLFAQSHNHDKTQSETMRAYLVRGAFEIIATLDNPDKNQFVALRGNKDAKKEPVYKDRRNLAANMLQEAAIIGFLNDADSKEINFVMQLASKLYHQVERTGHPGDTEDAMAHLRDIVAFDIFRYSDDTTDMGRMKLAKAKKFKRDYDASRKLLDQAVRDEDIGAVNEATVAFAFDRAIELYHAESQLYYRKSFLREDIPRDDYHRHKRDKKALDSVVYIANIDPTTNARTIDEDWAIQIKTKYDPSRSGIYSSEIGKVIMGEYDFDAATNEWARPEKRLRNRIFSPDTERLAIQSFFNGSAFSTPQGARIKSILS